MNDTSLLLREQEEIAKQIKNPHIHSVLTIILFIFYLMPIIQIDDDLFDCLPIGIAGVDKNMSIRFT